MSEPRNVLVTGATGQQGGTLARVLLQRGHRIRALTRSPDSEAAQSLGRAGAEVVQADLTDPASVAPTLEGQDAVFAALTPFEGGVEAETAMGVALVDGAREAGIRHFVYSSVASANKGTEIPHFDSKFAVEQHLKAADVPYTIIGPAFFMENLTASWNLESLREGVLAMALPVHREIQLVAVADIANFAALVIEEPKGFLGRRVDIAADALTPEDIVRILSKVSKRDIRYRELPISKLRLQSHDLALMFEWLDRVGYSVDIHSLRHAYPEAGWHTFTRWAKQRKWDRLLG